MIENYFCAKYFFIKLNVVTIRCQKGCPILNWNASNALHDSILEIHRISTHTSIATSPTFSSNFLLLTLTFFSNQIAQYLEEEFIEDQSKKIRELAGHTTDLKKFITSNNGQDLSLGLYLFDEYLQKTA